VVPPVIDYEGRFTFAATPRDIWDAIEDTGRFESWWPWLHEFHLEGRRLSSGSVLSGVVEPPLPYRMHIDVELVRTRRPTHLEAMVHGDLEGPAHVHLQRAGDGTAAEVGWHLEMMQRPMRVADRFAHPLLQWGHDRVVEATVSGFRHRMEEIDHPGDGPPDGGNHTAH
jgi:hypothetical protein